MLSHAQRVGPAVGLLRELKAARSDGRSLPDRDRLRRVHDRALATGGLAALVAEVMAACCPTAPPLDRGPAARVDDGDPPGFDIRREDRWVGVDLMAARLAVPLVSSRRDRSAAAVRVLEQLVHDVRRPAATVPAAHELARHLRQHAPELAGSVTVSSTGRVSTHRDDPAGDALAVAAIRLVRDHGTVHGRLGSALRSSGTQVSITGWETARRVSPEVRRLIGVIVEPDRRNPTVMGRTCTAIGLPPSLLDDALPVLDPMLAPLTRRSTGPPDSTAHRPDPPLAQVPDLLGLVYAVADLVTVATLLDPPGPPAERGAATWRWATLPR